MKGNYYKYMEEEQKNLEINEEVSKQLKKLNIGLEKYTKSSERLTLVLFGVASLQLLVGMFQLIASFFSNSPDWQKASLLILMLFGILLVYKKIEKNIFNDRSK